MQRDWSHEPGLAHSRNHASDTEAESANRCKARRELFRRVPVFRIVSAEATLEDEVVGQRDALVDGEPIADEVHEVLEDGFKVTVPWDGNGDVYSSCNCSPNVSRHTLGVSRKDLDGQSDGVDVGAVVGNDGQGEDDQAEFTKGSEVIDENGAEETTGLALRIASCVAVVAAVEIGGAHDGDAKHLSEEEGNDQTNPGEKEDFLARLRDGLVNSVVRSIRCPTSAEAVDCGAEGEDAAQLGSPDSHFDVHKVSAVGKDPKSDEEDDGRWNPGPELIGVDNLVAEKADSECTECDDEDASESRNVVIYSIDKLGAYDGVD